MITISNPIITKISDAVFSVAVILTYTDDTTQEVLGTKNINANIPRGGDAVSLLQPLIDIATGELLKEHDEMVEFGSQFKDFKDNVNSAIASKIQKKVGG